MVKEWLEFAEENLEAAAGLRGQGKFRSAVSRAYYAAHHAAHALLLMSGVAPPSRGNWKHGELPGEVRAAVRSRGGNVQWADYLHQCLQVAYNLRVQADYKPGQLVGDVHAAEARRVAFAVAQKARESLR
ncbi:MAG: HEPN domain-containing protein [Phycisphaerales bacterium]